MKSTQPGLKFASLKKAHRGHATRTKVANRGEARRTSFAHLARTSPKRIVDRDGKSDSANISEGGWEEAFRKAAKSGPTTR